MCGESRRFFSKGYALPKYMLEVKPGVTVFDLAVGSLPYLDIPSILVFIILKIHNEKYNIKQFIENRLVGKNVEYEICVLEHPTRGQAETVLLAKSVIVENCPLSIYNIDTYFYSSTLKDKLSSPMYDGVLGAFLLEENDDKWSFAEVNEDGFVIRTAEKEKISNYALTGLYNFSKAKYFFDVAQRWISENKTVRGEFYIAPMYNTLIEDGMKFVLDIVDEFIPIGTPDDYEKLRRTYSVSR